MDSLDLTKVLNEDAWEQIMDEVQIPEDKPRPLFISNSHIQKLVLQYVQYYLPYQVIDDYIFEIKWYSSIITPWWDDFPEVEFNVEKVTVKYKDTEEEEEEGEQEIVDEDEVLIYNYYSDGDFTIKDMKDLLSDLYNRREMEKITVITYEPLNDDLGFF